MSRLQIIFVSFFLTVIFTIISTPWDWGNTFFGDSLIAWVIYYIVGFLFSLFVVWAFLWAIDVLTGHEKHHLEEEDHHHHE